MLATPTTPLHHIWHCEQDSAERPQQYEADQLCCKIKTASCQHYSCSSQWLPQPLTATSVAAPATPGPQPVQCQALLSLVRTLHLELKTRWPVHLPSVLRPAAVHLEPRLPVDDLLGHPAQATVGTANWVRQHLLQLQEVHHKAFNQLNRAAAERAHFTDKQAAEHTLQVGDHVYLHNHVLRHNKIATRSRTPSGRNCTRSRCTLSMINTCTGQSLWQVVPSSKSTAKTFCW